MKDDNINNQNAQKSQTDYLKNWVMVLLTLIFVLLYVSALFGMITPIKDDSMVSHLEPIIFVIIGYYFGRLPAQANEKTLKNEINRQNQKADAAQQIKERAEQEKEILEEKIRNAKITLSSQMISLTSGKGKNTTATLEQTENSNQVIETAVKILDS